MTADRQASSLEIRPLFPAAERYDVAILGGGLAGLTLAIQLKQARPDTSVAVLEKREGPAPLAAFKVGESTVPSGAHYFAHVVKLEDHLRERQLIKCGLRYFLPAGDNSDLTRRVEVGPTAFPPHDNFQLDRGLFENELAARARSLGVDLLQGCRVGDVSLGSEHHTVSFTQLGEETSTQARWVVDAGGRASILKRQLGLAKEVGHTINSAWFRLAGGLDLEQWGADDDAWMAPMKEPGIRQYSTNHLLGEGYWVWLIPLASGPISIGVCADPRLHPFEEISELDSLIGWLREHEPQLAAAVEPRLGEIEDFLRVEDFAYGVERVFSPERWCLVGEAGAFADPFYSPGSDFIGYGNMITGDLIGRDLDGEEIGERLEWYNDFYLRTFEYVLSKYEDLYQVFGNAVVMLPKLSFDAYLSHSGLVLLAVQNRLTEFEFMQAVQPQLDRLYSLSMRVQQLFRDWHSFEQRSLEGVFMGAVSKALIEAFAGLVKEYSDEELLETVHEQARVAEGMALLIFDRAARVLETQPDRDRPMNPYAVGLRPERWEEDGLYGEPGVTLDEARERAAGLDALFIEYEPAGGAAPTN